MNKKDIAEMTDEVVQSLIGKLSDEICPDCGKKLWKNLCNQIWCGSCGYSNDPDLSKSIKELLDAGAVLHQ